MEGCTNYYDSEAKSAESYRPINLLPIETIRETSIPIIMESQRLIPDHQFGFRNKHTIIEQKCKAIELLKE
jgi:hypothetical protein